MPSRQKVKKRYKKAIAEPKSKYHGNNYYDTKEDKNIFRTLLPSIILVLVFTLLITFGPTLGAKGWNSAVTNLNGMDNQLARDAATIMDKTGQQIAKVYNEVLKITKVDKSSKVQEETVSVPQGVAGGYDIVPRVDTSKDKMIVTFEELPKYTGSEEILELNNNDAAFTKEDLAMKSNQTFSELDKLGRPGQANALLTPSMQPTESREGISSVTPPGWKMDGKSNNLRVVLQEGRKAQWFYDRSHLIGFQLGGVNAEPANLVTGARTFNDPNMKTYETVVDSAIEDGFTVRYQVTPVYNEEELVPRGVQMRAYSLEDEGKEVNFNVYIYNVNPGFVIDYRSGALN